MSPAYRLGRQESIQYLRREKYFLCATWAEGEKLDSSDEREVAQPFSALALKIGLSVDLRKVWCDLRGPRRGSSGLWWLLVEQDRLHPLLGESLLHGKRGTMRNCNTGPLHEWSGQRQISWDGPLRAKACLLVGTDVASGRAPHTLRVKVQNGAETLPLHPRTDGCCWTSQGSQEA